MIRVEVLVGAPGCGKTSELLAEMASVKGRYVFALPTIDQIEEKLVELNREVAKSGTKPVIRAIHSRAGSNFGLGVSRAIMEAIGDCSILPHVVLLITHEGLMGTEFGCAEACGWHARVDEVPGATAAERFNVPSSSRFFEATYDLSPVEGTSWHSVTLKPDASSIGDIMADDLVSVLAAFHKRAKSPQGVFVDVADWRDARQRSRPVQWWSAWTPADLAPFSTAVIAGSGFFYSLTYLATRKWFGDEVELVRREVGQKVERQQPEVRIRYFTRGHRASTEWWFPTDPKKPRDGKRCLAAVCRLLEEVGDLGYWSGNAAVADYFEGRLPGQQVRPRIAGSNNYRTAASCALIYSSKAQADDAALCAVFGLSKQDIERAREQEDIWQFVMRGAVRNADFAGVYTVYLYDVWQADTLADMLRDAGITDRVTIEAVAGAGILDVERPRPGLKVGARAAACGMSYEERVAQHRQTDRERKQKQRGRERAEREEAGTLRRRGRPRRSAHDNAPS